MSFGVQSQAIERAYRRVSPKAIPSLETAERYLREHWREQPTLDELAAVAGLSPCHFHHLFSRHFGFGPKWLMTELQLREARRLLLAGVPNRDVSAACGFASPSHFTARFKRWTGLTPTRWLRQKRNEPSEHPDGNTLQVAQTTPFQ